MPPSQIPERHHATLAKFQSTLPGNEYAALEAWLTTFYPFQLDWLLDFSHHAVCNKSRQIGMSHTTAAFAVLWGVFLGELTTVISMGQLESDEVLQKARAHQEVLVALGSEMASKRGKNNASTLSFASGGRIIALPSSGGRSFTGNVFLDEFAYHMRPEEVWDAAIAVTMHGFRARVASTPNGVGNAFHDLWADPKVHEGWARHEFTLQRAIDDGMSVDIENCWKLAKHDPRIFGQMFECKFLDGELQYLPTELIETCVTDDLSTTGGNYYAGLDIGKTVDLTVLYIVRKCGRECVTAYIETHKRTDADGLQDMVDRAFKTFGVTKLCVDATGIGNFPAQSMQKKHGYYRVEPIDFTLKKKEEMATRLYTALVGRAVKLPKSDAAFPYPPALMSPIAGGVAKQIKDDLCSIRRIVTTAGNVRYDAPHTDKGHADTAWALALALDAASQEQPRGHVAVA